MELVAALNNRIQGAIESKEFCHLAGYPLLAYPHDGDGREGAGLTYQFGLLVNSLISLTERARSGMEPEAGASLFDLYDSLREKKASLLEKTGDIPNAKNMVWPVFFAPLFILYKDEIRLYLLKRARYSYLEKVETAKNLVLSTFKLDGYSVEDAFRRMLIEYYLYITRPNISFNIFKTFDLLETNEKIRIVRNIHSILVNDKLYTEVLGLLFYALGKAADLIRISKKGINDEKVRRALTEMLSLGNKLPLFFNFEEFYHGVAASSFYAKMLTSPSLKVDEYFDKLIAGDEEGIKELIKVGVDYGIWVYGKLPVGNMPGTTLFWEILGYAFGVSDKKGEGIGSFVRLFRRLTKALYKSGVIKSWYEYWMNKENIPTVVQNLMLKIKGYGLGVSSNWSHERVARYIEGELLKKRVKKAHRATSTLIIEDKGVLTLYALNKLQEIFNTPLKQMSYEQTQELLSAITDVSQTVSFIGANAKDSIGAFTPDVQEMLMKLSSKNMLWGNVNMILTLSMLTSLGVKDVLEKIVNEGASFSALAKPTFVSFINELARIKDRFERFKRAVNVLVAGKKRVDLTFNFTMEVKRRHTKTVQALAWLLTIGAELGAERAFELLKILPMLFMVTPSVDRRIKKSISLVTGVNLLLNKSVVFKDFAIHRKIAQFLLGNFYDKNHDAFLMSVDEPWFVTMCYDEYLNKAQKILEIVEPHLKK